MPGLSPCMIVGLTSPANARLGGCRYTVETTGLDSRISSHIAFFGHILSLNVPNPANPR